MINLKKYCLPNIETITGNRNRKASNKQEFHGRKGFITHKIKNWFIQVSKRKNQLNYYDELGIRELYNNSVQFSIITWNLIYTIYICVEDIDKSNISLKKSRSEAFFLSLSFFERKSDNTYVVFDLLYASYLH